LSKAVVEEPEVTTMRSGNTIKSLLSFEKVPSIKLISKRGYAFIGVLSVILGIAVGFNEIFGKDNNRAPSPPCQNCIEYLDGRPVTARQTCGEKCCYDRTQTSGPKGDSSFACLEFTGWVAKDGSCNGIDACQGARIEKVHVKSCIGKLACSGFIGTEVKDNSCNQDNSCLDAVIDKVSDKSCIGVSACQGASIQKDASENSCDDQAACKRAKMENISGSCKGLFACENANIKKVVGRSCIGANSCNNATIFDTVSFDSCVGSHSCSGATVGSISRNSCDGEYACHKVQYPDKNLDLCMCDNCSKLNEPKRSTKCPIVEYKNGESVNGMQCGKACCYDSDGRSGMFGTDIFSCQGFTGTVTKDGSCNGVNACHDAVIEKVSDESCVGMDACLKAKVTLVSNQSCQGIDACRDLRAVEVIGNSCKGDHACLNASLHKVSDNSCSGDMACQSMNSLL
jgi:hypothetical protein